MKEHPIIFSDDMVRAILEGRKTMTRRVVKFHKPFTDHSSWQAAYPHPVNGFIFTDKPLSEKYCESAIIRMSAGRAGKVCPYGEVGNRLWVRETWFHVGDRIVYKADEEYGSPWKPSIYMPRWASRLTLEITDIRVERLQEITEEDIWDEGIQPLQDIHTEFDFHFAFKDLWDSINGKKHPWASNPWVWVISFRKVK